MSQVNDIGNVYTSIMCFVLKEMLGMHLASSLFRQLQLLREGYRMHLSTSWSLTSINLCKSGKTTFPSVASAVISVPGALENPRGLVTSQFSRSSCGERPAEQMLPDVTHSMPSSQLSSPLVHHCPALPAGPNIPFLKCLVPTAAVTPGVRGEHLAHLEGPALG